MPQRPVGNALHGPAVECRDRHRHQKHDQQDHRNHGEADRDQDQEGDQRDKAADHEDIAMGEIDHADDAVDHGVADGDQAIDRTEYNAVDELLSEIVHALPLLRWTRRNLSSVETNVSSARCLAVTFNKGDPDVQPEPEPGPAESEPGSEARPAAGRRTEARSTAAGSQPSEAQPWSADRALVRN